MQSYLKVLKAVLKDSLKTGEHSKYAQEYIKAVLGDGLLAEKDKEIIAEAQKCVDNEKKAYVVSRKNPYSDKIDNAIKQRRKIISGLYGLGVVAETDENEDVRFSGAVVKNAVTTFRNENSKRNVDETERIDSFMKKLETDYATDLANINAEKMVGKLRAKNEQIDKWCDERDKMKAEMKGLIVKTRNLTDNALEDIRQHIVAHVVLDGIENYQTTIDKLNDLHDDTLKKTASHKKHSNGEEDKEKEQKEKNKNGKKNGKNSKEDTDKTNLQPEKANEAPADNKEKESKPVEENDAPKQVEDKDKTPEQGGEDTEKAPISPAQ